MDPTKVTPPSLNKEILGKEKEKEKVKERKGGYFTNWIGNALTAPQDQSATNVLVSKRWKKVINDLTTFLLVDKLNLDAGKQLTENVGLILQQVIQGLANIRNERTPDELGRNLIVNILKEIFEQDLLQYDPINEEPQLRAALGKIFDNFMLKAGLDEEHISNQPDGVQVALYPNKEYSDWTKWGLAKAAKALAGDMGMDKLQELFTDTCVEFCTIQKRLEAISQDEILEYNEGADKLAEYLVTELILPNIRNNQELPFDLSILRNEKNKQFLKAEIAKVLSTQQAGPEGAIINEAWGALEKRLITAVKAIFAIVLTPTQEGQSVEERRDQILDGMLNRLVNGRVEFIQRAEVVDALDDSALIDQLNQLVSSYQAITQTHQNLETKYNQLKDSFKGEPNSPEHAKFLTNLNHLKATLWKCKGELWRAEKFYQEATCLLARTTATYLGLGKKEIKTWESEANALYQKAWKQNDKLPREQLLEKLKDWKEQQKIDPDWKLAYSEEAKALIAREKLSWGDEAKHLLKEKIYEELAQHTMNGELDSQKFAGCFPNIFPAEKVFAELYHLLGNTFLEFHETIRSLEQKGSEACSYFSTTKLDKVPAFVDSLLTKLVDSLEENAAEGEDLDVGYEFLNEAISHLLKKPEYGGAVGAGPAAFKQQILSTARNILLTVLASTIKTNSAGSIPPERALSGLLENLIRDAKTGMTLVSDSCRALSQLDEQEKKAAIRQVADQLGIKNLKFKTIDEVLVEQYRQLLEKWVAKNSLLTDSQKKIEIDGSCKDITAFDQERKKEAIRAVASELGLKNIKFLTTQEVLVQQYQELLLKSLSRDIVKHLLPEELVNSMLPPMLADVKLWELLTDELFAPYLSGIYEKSETFRLATEQKDSVEAKQHRLTDADRAHFMPLIDELVKKWAGSLSDINFGELLGANKSDPNAIDFSILDQLIGNALRQNGEVAGLIESALPKIIESILAFHLNPKDEMQSPQRAATLFWNVLDNVKQAYDKLHITRESWEAMPELVFSEADVNEKDLKAYRKENKIPPSTPESPQMYKQCYIWAQTNLVLKETMRSLMDEVIPESLWNERIPEQWQKLLTREQISSSLFSYLKEGYEHSIKMKDLVASGKEQVVVEETRKWGGLGIYIETQIKTALQKFIKVEKSDGENTIKDEDGALENIPWINAVLQSLMAKEQAEGSTLVTDMTINATYALLGKLLAGGLASLNNFLLFPEMATMDASPEKGATLVGKIAELIPVIRSNFYKLNALQAGQDAAIFPQLNRKNLKKQLAVEGTALHRHEKMDPLPTQFTTDQEGKVVLHVTIRNSQTNEMRQVSVDIQKFVHWELTYHAINELLSNDEWETLVPEFMQKFLTKELVAGFAAPLIEGLHQMQEPLQKKAEAGQKLLAKLNAEALPMKKREMQALDLATEFGAKLQPKPTDEKRRILDKLGLDFPKGHERAEMAKTDLEAFVDEMIIGKFNQMLNNMGNQTKKLSKKLPDFLDRLIKDLLKTSDDTNIRNLRELLVQRGVYLALSELLKPAKRDASGQVISANDRSAEHIIEKLKVVLLAFQAEGATPQSLAKTLLDVLIPEKTWNEIFTGVFEDKDLVWRKKLIDLLSTSEDPAEPSIVEEIFAQHKRIKVLGTEAEAAIEKLDKDLSGDKTPVGGGLKKMVQTMCDAIDTTIDELGQKTDLIFEQPLLINNLTKEAFKDPTTVAVIKQAIHTMVNICMAKMLQPTHTGQSQEARVLELINNLINQYDAHKPMETAEAWLKEFLPEETRKDILPEFLHKVFTHKFLAEAFLKEYVVQISEMAKVLNAPAVYDEDTSRMQDFVKNLLVEYKDKEITGFGGGVTPIEKVLLGALGGDYKDDANAKELGPTLDKFLNANIAKVMGTPKVKDLLHKQFLSQALVAALPMLGEIDLAVDLPDYPQLSPAQLQDPQALKLLGIDLPPQKKGESDQVYNQRVANRNFEIESAKRLMEMILPNGTKDLILPEVTQDIDLSKLNEVIADQIQRVTHKDDRILMAIDLFGVDPADKQDYDKLMTRLETKGNLAGEEKACEELFKKGLVSFAMKKIEENVATSWPQPFKWLAQAFVKVIAWLALKIAVSQQVWKVVSDPATDDKLRKLLWKLLSFAKDYVPAPTDEKKLSAELDDSFKKSLDKLGLLKGLQWFVGPAIADIFKDKNLVNLITGPKTYIEKIHQYIKVTDPELDQLRFDTLHKLKSKILAVDAKGNLPDAEVIAIFKNYLNDLQKEIKAQKANPKIVDNLQKEKNIVEEFLQDATKSLIAQAIADSGAKTKKEIEVVMKLIRKLSSAVNMEFAKDYAHKLLAENKTAISLRSSTSS